MIFINTPVINPDGSLKEELAKLGITLPELIKSVHKNRIHVIKQDPPESDMDLNIAIEKFLGYVEISEARYRPSTRVTYNRICNKFEEFMYEKWERDKTDKKTAGNVKKTDVELFLRTVKSRQSELNPCTYNQWLSIISSLYSYLIEELAVVTRSPTVRIKRLPEGDGYVRFLTKKEQSRVLIRALQNKQTGERDYIIIFLVLNSGLRLEELVSLDVSHIDFDADRLWVINGKGGKNRPIFLTDDMKTVLKKYLRNIRLGPFFKGNKDTPFFLNFKGPHAFERLTREAAEKMVVRVFRSLGIRSGAMHRLRHTFSINLLEDGFNIVEIMRLLGHSSIQTTIKYLRLSDEQILRKIKNNFPLAFLSVKNLPEMLNETEAAKLKNSLERIGVDEC